MRRQGWWFLPILGLIVGLGGLTGTAITTAQDANTLVYAAQRDPFTPDPHVTTLVVADALVAWNVYEGLVGYKPGSVEIAPALATSWKVSADGRTYTFQLREGVKFHDGTSLDAQAVVRNIERLKALNLGRARYVDPVVSARATSPREVVIQLKEPYAYFLQNLPRVMFICPRVFDERQKGGDWARDWLSTNTCGTGPYRLVSWRKNENHVLESFADHWNPAIQGRPQRVVIRVVPEDAVRIQLLERGDADMIYRVGADTYARLQAAAGVQVLRLPGFDQTIITLNTSRTAFQKREVRQAVATAFPYEAMARSALRGFARVPTSHLARNMEGFDPTLPPFRQDLTRAKSLLDKAGYAPGQLTFKYVWVAGIEEERLTAVLWQDALKKIGVNMENEGVPFATLVSIVTNPQTAPDASILLGGTETADAVAYLAQWFHSRNLGKQWNWAYYQNPKVDQMLDETGRSTDPKRRAELLKQLQRILREEMPVMPVYAPPLTEAMRTRVKGWAPSPGDFHSVIRFYQLTLEGR